MPKTSQNTHSGALRDLLEAKLADSELTPNARRFLLDAFDSEQDGSSADPKRAYLESVRVRGFRGVGEESELPIAPKPGLTLVTGSNGSGKSTFAEGIEIALTGDNARWKDRSGTWRESWRNLHHTGTPQVEVDLFLPDEATTATVRRTWDGNDVADSRAELRHSDAEPDPLSSLGWERDLSLYRPFLSYSELGQVISGRPSEMYDAVATILGLEALTSADKRLREHVKEREDAKKRVTTEKAELVETLAALEDSRAQWAAGELGKNKPNLGHLRDLVSGQHTPDDEKLTALRRLSELHGPDPAAVSEAVRRLRSAAETAATVRDTSAETARRRADLLDRALAHHRAHPGEATCPVCGSDDRIGPQWAEETESQISLLRTEAEQAENARRELDTATTALHRLVQDPPDWLPDRISPAWRAWLACRELTEPAALAQEAERAAEALTDACRKVREEATGQLAELDHRWLDAATKLAAWLARAEQVENDRAEVTELKAARTWLRSIHDELREERMRPLAEMSQLYWTELRQQSSVELGGVRLTGRTNQRKVVLDVSVDDIPAPALGVMSQGELLSLALSLFLPRAASPESPFRFLVIDDPVQSMDPAKVEGLARVLSMIAETRQVVVFTHDTRLAESVRYQRLPATILEVVRKERSHVRVSTSTDPVLRLLEEAEQFLKDRAVTEEVLSLVLPGLCRNALEAAFKEPVWRRLLGEGYDHPEITERIARAGKLRELAALALFGDTRRARDVLPHLRDTYGDWAADLVADCDKGSHEPVSIPDPKVFRTNTARLARKVRAL